MFLNFFFILVSEVIFIFDIINKRYDFPRLIFPLNCLILNYFCFFKLLFLLSIFISYFSLFIINLFSFINLHQNHIFIFIKFISIFLTVNFKLIYCFSIISSLLFLYDSLNSWYFCIFFWKRIKISFQIQFLYLRIIKFFIFKSVKFFIEIISFLLIKNF